MKLQEIEQMWAEDCQLKYMTGAEIEASLANLSSLHAKYFPILNQEKKNIAIARAKYKKLNLEKFEFYTDGDYEGAPKEWKRPPKGVIHKNKAQIYLDADSDLVEATLKISAIEARIQFLTEIIQQIYKMGFHINGIINIRKFEGGG